MGVQLENGEGDVGVNGEGKVGTAEVTTNGQVFDFEADEGSGHSDATYTYNVGQTAYYTPTGNPIGATAKLEFSGPINEPDGCKVWTYKKWSRDESGNWKASPDYEGTFKICPS